MTQPSISLLLALIVIRQSQSLTSRSIWHLNGPVGAAPTKFAPDHDADQPRGHLLAVHVSVAHVVHDLGDLFTLLPGRSPQVEDEVCC